MSIRKNPVELLQNYGVSGVKITLTNNDVRTLSEFLDFVCAKMNLSVNEKGYIEGDVTEIPSSVISAIYGLLAIIRYHHVESEDLFGIVGAWDVDERFNKPQQPQPTN